MLKKLEKHRIIFPFNDSYKELNNYESKKFEDLLFDSQKKIKFTKRQVDCIRLLLKGNTTKSIAKKLNISPRTVKHYLDHLKISLKCKNIYDLIIKVINLSI